MTSSPPSSTDDAPTRKELGSELHTLADRINSLTSWVEVLEDENEDLRKEVNRLTEELQRENERRRQLEADIKEVQASTSLLEKAKQSELSSPEERAVVCIQKLKQKAERTESKKVAINQQDGWSAVNYSVDRTTVYDIFRKAEHLLERPDVLWYQSEPRSSEKDSRLILDLTKGELPESVAGHNLTATRGASTTPGRGAGGEQSDQTNESVNAD